MAGSLAIAAWVSEGRRPDRRLDASVLSLLLAAAWINLVLTMALFNITFGFAIYFAVPLLAVVLAAPPRLRRGTRPLRPSVAARSSPATRASWS